MTTYNRFNSIKVLAFSDRIWEIVRTGLCIPVIWHIYPSNKCQHDCRFCIMADEKEENRNAMLSGEILLKAVEDARRLGIRAFHFSGGGEPLTNPSTVPTMRLAKEMGITTILSTNGILLTQEVVDAADHIRISLDAARASTHRMIHRSETFNKIIDNIQKIAFSDRKKIGIGMVVTSENCNEVIDLCLLAQNLWMGFVHVRPEWNRDRDYTQRLRVLMDTIEHPLKETAKKLNIDVHFSVEKFEGIWTPRLWEKCRATPLLACLKANGQFIVCQDRTDLEFGDYYSHTFEEIWYSDRHKKVIEQICIDECPRCVETKKNEYIEQIFIKDNCLMTVQ